MQTEAVAVLLSATEAGGVDARGAGQTAQEGPQVLVRLCRRRDGDASWLSGGSARAGNPTAVCGQAFGRAPGGRGWCGKASSASRPTLTYRAAAFGPRRISHSTHPGAVTSSSVYCSLRLALHQSILDPSAITRSKQDGTIHTSGVPCAECALTTLQYYTS
jgi:hypothetical protein